MDLESLETQTLLKKRTPQRQSLVLKLAVLLCGLGLLVGVAVPSTNHETATLKEKQKVTAAAAGVSSTSRPAPATGLSQRRKPPAPRRSSKLGSRGRSSLRRFPDPGLST